MKKAGIAGFFHWCFRLVRSSPTCRFTMRSEDLHATRVAPGTPGA
jgi:hypothetical protein